MEMDRLRRGRWLTADERWEEVRLWYKKEAMRKRWETKMAKKVYAFFESKLTRVLWEDIVMTTAWVEGEEIIKVWMLDRHSVTPRHYRGRLI